ncbi:MAG: hypothetical protein ACOYJB_03940 [Christensenellaceae bacterium]|jgi:hypothetical protein
MLKMRTIKQAAEEIRSLDPHTAITEYAIRQIILSESVPCVKRGRKYLINMDALLQYLNNGTDIQQAEVNTSQTGIIRQI